jgi:hypothetical protein
MVEDDIPTFYWLVGLCEGEAWFGYSQRTPHLQVESTDEHVVARIAVILGVSYRRVDYRVTRPNSSVTFKLVLRGRRALQLMKRLQPYLSPRRARAIDQIEQQYLSDRRISILEYRRVPLPPLKDLPYAVGQ